MNLTVGMQLGHYEILEPLGAGGMGEVYRARDTKLRREVALKILPAHVSSNPDSLSRFEREALALAQISHPNILAIHDFGRYAGITLAVTELLEGENLRKRLDRCRISSRNALEIASHIADGLAAAHAKGIVHRDVKPENIFLTSDGQIKILDFGLARLDGKPVHETEGATSFPTQTDPATIKGTIGYMSPEQLRGQQVDGRSDIFSLGCVLFEMMTGRRAFSRATVADTMTAILKDPPPDMRESGRMIPPEAERVVEHCLEKDPQSRYQSARDLALHLRSLSSSPEISFPAWVRSGRKSRRLIWLAALSLAVIMAVAGFFLSGFLRSGAASDMKPSVAVFYFDNNTGDESLDWLRTALTNMLVTDLSQSPQIEVLSTDRLYQLLDEMGQLDAPITSFEVVRDLAKKAGVGTVVLGDFVRAGDQFRLNTRVQDASNGRILATERVEGRGESSIFSMVDDLTRRIKGSLEVSQVPGDYADRGIQEVTTSSVQALRYYVEGNNLHIQSKEREAIPLLEKAVEVDPNFAMALAKLSVVHWNLGHLKEAYDFAHRSLENVDRLTARERYYIEGRYYSLKPETFDKAITAYEQAIKRYPHDDSARHNLAGVYSSMERYEEAIRHLEILRKRGNSFSGTYTNLAFAYASLGQYNRGREVLEEFVSRYPESAVGHRDLGTFLVRMGHNDEALVEFDRAENLSPGDLEVEMGRWTVFLITGRWNEAGKTTTRVRSSADPFWQFRGLLMEATNQLFHGRSMNAENSLEKAAGIFPDKGPFRCKALTYLASILRARQEFGKAMETAKQALSSGAGYPVESAALRELTLSQMASGQTAQAQQTLGKMRVGLNGYPPELSARRNDLMRGWISLLAGDYVRSARYSESALTELSGKEHDWEKATLWYNLGAAYWQAGNHQVAAAWFTRLHDNPLQGMSDPINYIRSLYYLAKYHHDSGDSDKARAYYRRMVELWGSGDLSPELVREARLRR